MARMDRTAKKQVEAAYLERFKALLPSFPIGTVEPFEEPDFLISLSNSVLGIELTELHRESPAGASPQQAREAMRNRVIELAQELYLTGNHPAARITVFMEEGKHIGRSEVERLAQDICNLAIRNLPDRNSSNEEFYEWTNRAYFPEVVSNIRVHRLDAITETHFNCPGATWVASLAHADIRRTFDAKDPKYSTYRKNCAEVWLVINSDVRSMSTWFRFDSATLTETFFTSFDRAFVLRHFYRRLHELKVRQPSGA